ncbi:MAG: transketolase [Planctomycetota bacterium]|nr:MAG: transketolase [Planctomycetota bacterium]
MSDIDTLCINTIRALSIDAIQKANSGHPGLPLGAAPMAYVLWQRHLKFDPGNPGWPDRDRFVLSAGHGSALLYSLLHLAGYDVTLEDIKSFRQWESKTPGHPEFQHAPGVEATTGPLGQGTANAVGMAIAERFLAEYFNRSGFEVVNHYIFVLAGDGDLMEGIAAEAGSLAGHLKLGKLILLYDSNDVTLDGPANLSFSEDLAKRYESYGWQVIRVENGDTDVEAIDKAIAEAKADTSRPTLIEVKTTIGYGSPNKSGKASAHGSPLGEEEVALTKKALGWEPEEKFFVPEEARAHFKTAVEHGISAAEGWKQRLDAYEKEFPDLAEKWRLAMSGRFPEGWDREMPSWETGEKVATRKAAGAVLNRIAEKIPWLFCADADLSCSTQACIKSAGDFSSGSRAGRNLRSGVREHAMAGVANGIAYHGGMRAIASTFFIFSDYMRPSIRLAALSGLPVIYHWTHDSIAVGEDGPTHQPVEHIMALRIVPNLSVVRPCDANETVEAWRYAMRRKEGPTALVFSRQGLPVFDRDKYTSASNLARGAYVLSEAEGGDAQAVIIATGSEVQLALEAQELLAKDGLRARVVSMPCWEAFEAESDDYKESVLPKAVTARVAVEAGVSLGWERWVGMEGAIIGVDRFGSSAPGNLNMEKYGMTAENVAGAVRELLKKG